MQNCNYFCTSLIEAVIQHKKWDKNDKAFRNQEDRKTRKEAPDDGNGKPPIIFLQQTQGADHLVKAGQRSQDSASQGEEVIRYTSAVGKKRTKALDHSDGKTLYMWRGKAFKFPRKGIVMVYNHENKGKKCERSIKELNPHLFKIGESISFYSRKSVDCSPNGQIKERNRST